MKKLIICDVCNTLVNTNSTFSYVDFLLNKGIKPYYSLIFHNKLLQYFYRFNYLVFNFDLKVFLIQQYFKGLSVEKIKSLSLEYFKRYENKIFPHMLELINREKTSSKIIFLSSSINPPIDFLQDKFGISSFSSKLEEKDGKYTGKILKPLWGKKEIIFDEGMIDLKEYGKIDFYTDNINDSGLIKYLNIHHKQFKVYIVPYDNKKYWNKYFSNNNINYEFVV